MRFVSWHLPSNRPLAGQLESGVLGEGDLGMLSSTVEAVAAGLLMLGVHDHPDQSRMAAELLLGGLMKADPNSLVDGGLHVGRHA